MSSVGDSLLTLKIPPTPPDTSQLPELGKCS